MHAVLSSKEENARDYYYYNYYSRMLGGVDTLVVKKIQKFMTPYFHANTKEQTIKAYASKVSSLGIVNIDALLNNLQSPLKTSSSGWQNFVKSLEYDKSMLKEINCLCIATIVPVILTLADNELINVARKVRAIAPVRATTERYYRRQDLAIDEVDYKGQNLPMYLASLTYSEEESFRKWTLDNFGFEVKITQQTGHVELSISEKRDGAKYNLADSGFGFSQVLPIIAQLWSIARLQKDRTSHSGKNIPNIITIEQPELHLHPSFQAKVADMFVAAIALSIKENVELRLVVETHSEAIINRIGHLISNKVINEKDVNVVLFEKDEFADCTNVKIANYDNEGYLENWPYGFFQP